MMTIFWHKEDLNPADLNLEGRGQEPASALLLFDSTDICVLLNTCHMHDLRW